jgi:hypothetical protein
MILSGAGTRADGSLGLRFSTPELQPADKTALFELLNKNLKVLLQPTDGEVEALHEVKQTLDFKTPGQRLRAVLFIEWKQTTPDCTFEEFYIKQMDKIIEVRKSRLQQP